MISVDTTFSTSKIWISPFIINYLTNDCESDKRGRRSAFKIWRWKEEVNSRYEDEKEKCIQDMKVKRRSEFKIWRWKEEVHSRYEGEKKKWIQDMKVKRKGEFIWEVLWVDVGLGRGVS